MSNEKFTEEDLIAGGADSEKTEIDENIIDLSSPEGEVPSDNGESVKKMTEDERKKMKKLFSDPRGVALLHLMMELHGATSGGPRGFITKKDGLYLSEIIQDLASKF